MNRAKLLTLAGYTGFFWAAFFLFAYWTFPYERVAAFLTDKVAESGVGYTLEIGSLSPNWLTGVELEDVKVLKQGAPAELTVPTKDGQPAGDGAIRISEAHARVGVFALLMGGKAFSFDAELEQGEIEGAYDEDGESKHLDATLSKIDLGKLGVLDSVIPLPVKGTITGEADLTLGKEPTKSSGMVKLKIQGLTIGDGKAKLKVGGMGGITLDPVEAGTVTMELEVKEGVGNVKKMSADGKDIELEGSGEVRFSDPLSRSRLDILLRINFTDAYKNKSSRSKALFSLLDGSSASQVRAAKTPDGALQYRLTGTLAAARAVPSGRSRVGNDRKPSSARKASPTAPSAPEEDEPE